MCVRVYVNVSVYGTCVCMYVCVCSISLWRIQKKGVTARCCFLSFRSVTATSSYACVWLEASSYMVDRMYIMGLGGSMVGLSWLGSVGWARWLGSVGWIDEVWGSIPKV